MDHGPLVIDKINAWAEFVRRVDQHIPVRAAFWFKSTEDYQGFLYIASEKIDRDGTAAAYGDVIRVAKEMDEFYVDPMRVKLIGVENPLARGVLDIYSVRPVKRPVQADTPVLGGRSVEELYLYPAPQAIALS
jgi:hypothetical protein